MARSKADIEKDWKKAETTLTDVLKKAERPGNFEKFEDILDNLTKAWASWNKYLAEADKKISEKDWKDDKKLDADRKKFKTWVISQRDKEEPKFQKEILGVQKEFAEWVADNRELEKKMKAIKAKILKTLSDFKTDRDAAGAITTLEELAEQIGELQNDPKIKDSIFKEGRALNKGIQAATPALEKAQKLQLRVEGDVNKLTYEDIRNDMKLFKAYCQMLKQPEHARFFEATNYGKNGTADAYNKFIKTNTVNVAASLVAEFDEIGNSERPDWAKAPWLKVVGQIDTMLGRDSRHLVAFKEKLIAARSA